MIYMKIIQTCSIMYFKEFYLLQQAYGVHLISKVRNKNYSITRCVDSVY